jgi:predicted amino acid racemase
MRYPEITINLSHLYNNAALMLRVCREHSLEPVAVIKGFNAIEEMVETIIEAGFTCLASSRLAHLHTVKALSYPVKTMALRIPMLSEIDELIGVADISLNSSLATVQRLNDAAQRAGKLHSVILMRDVGDLREGIYDTEEFITTACEIENRYKNIHLLGIGTNVFCYGTVRPTADNIGELTANAKEIESRIGRKLDVISGGSSSSVPLILRGDMPDGINQLRIGSILMYHTMSLREDELAELSNVLTMTAEIIELSEKPTYPKGELGLDAFGNKKQFIDLGVRRRAILALGAFDIGDPLKLMPTDKNVKVLGASSDHLVVDIHDCAENYALGDTITFRMPYQSVLLSTASPLIHRRILKRQAP